MYEHENQRAVHLLILLVCSIMIFILTGESMLLGWDMGAIVLLLIGLGASWVIYITERIPTSMRIWVYFILAMLATFFYGTHETSIFDLAPLMMVIIMLYSAAENYSIIRLNVVIYFLIIGYDFVFVVDHSVEVSSLVVTRILLHMVLVCLTGYLAKNSIERRRKERKITDNIIAELEETNRRTEDFLTNVSHELRTPINAVTGITSVMLKNEGDEEKKKNLLSVQMAGHRLFGQIGDILDYTEIDTGRIKVSEESYMISSLINDIIIGKRLSERKNMLDLILDIDPGIPSVLLGDERKIKKILEHLIDNAFKFTQRGGIYVRVYALPKEYGVNLCIKVSDTGVGISQEELVKIRERFYQTSRGRNRRAGGLGLGLSIVYGMVSAMEGFIQIESTPGEGTTVSVSIPQKVLDEAHAMTLENQEDLCVACYLRPEKYEVPEVRGYYNEMILHMVQGLDMPLHRVSSMDELERLTTVYQLTHLFIGREEYDENPKYFEELNRKINVIVVADKNYTLPKEKGLRLLGKPVYILSIINMLKVGLTEEESLLEKKNLICPGIRLLVVDDEPMNLMVAEGIFKNYQMCVKKAESGRKAIELCEKEEFDLIFLDHMMPEMDGVETLKRIRRIYANTNRTVTIIAFTANAVSGAREMFLNEGFDEFVSKPVETLELERVLKKVLPKSAIHFVDVEMNKITNVERAEKKKGDQKEEVIIDPIGNECSGENRLHQLEEVGIHTQSGIQYCGGDEGFYEDLLTKFAEDAKKKESELDKFFLQGDLDNYGILVHALKGTAKMVGADSLSENAKSAEMAAKKHDTDYIRDHHEGLLSEYRQVVQCICNALDLKSEEDMKSEKEEGVEISAKEFLEQLAKLKEGLDTFEADKAESVIAEIGSTMYRGDLVSNLLRDVHKDVENFEFSAAAKKVEMLMRNVEGGEVG